MKTIVYCTTLYSFLRSNKQWAAGKQLTDVFKPTFYFIYIT